MAEESRGKLRARAPPASTISAMRFVSKLVNPTALIFPAACSQGAARHVSDWSNRHAPAPSPSGYLRYHAIHKFNSIHEVLMGGYYMC